MNTQEILTRVNDAMQPYEAIEKAEESQSYVAWEMKRRLTILAADLEAQLRLECASKNGVTNATRTIVRLLEHEKKHGCRPSLQYAWLDANGRQCVCDGYRAFRLNEPLPLEPRPDNAGEPIDLDKIMPDGTGYVATPLPSLQELKAHIAVERAKAGGKRGKDILWDFGEYKPAVNASFLLDILQVFPDATEIFYRDGVSFVMSPLVVHNERGDAILLPVRTTAKQGEVAALQKAQAEAEAAIRDQAAAEGIDPEALKERLERKAKRKADAEKALRDRLGQIKSEMAMHENYALEMDEFEHLVYLIDEVARYEAA